MVSFYLKHASLPRQQFTKKTLYALYRKARAVHARVYGTESHIAICHRSVGTMRDATQRHGNIRIVAQRMFSLRWYMQNLAVNRFLGSRNSWTCFLGSCVICVGPLKMVSYGVSVWAAGVESVLSGALDVIGLRMGLHTSQGNVLFLFPLLSMGPCWCNDFFLFVFFLPSAVEWRHLFGNIPRINVLLHEMQTQPGLLRIFRGIEVTTHRIPNLISNMCAYDFCSLIACSRFARFFCSMQLLYMSLQFGRFHAMLKNGLGRCRKRNGHQSMTNGCINKIAQIHCWKIWSLRVLSLVVVFSFITTWIHHGRTSVQTSIVRTGATLRFWLVHLMANARCEGSWWVICRLFFELAVRTKSP